MIRHALTRKPGERRFDVTDLAQIRRLAATGALDTLPQQAVDAMSDPDGIEALADVSFEIESNRLGRPVTTALLSAVTTPPTVIAADDPPTMPLSALTSGRSNPTRAFAIADAAACDACYVWDSVEEGDEHPVAFARAATTTVATVRNASAATAAAGDGSEWQVGKWFVEQWVPSRSALPGDVGRVATGYAGPVFYAVRSGGAALLSSGNGFDMIQVAAPAGGGARYSVGPTGFRTFTLVAYFASDEDVQITPTMFYRNAANTLQWVGSNERQVTVPGGSPTLTRIVATVTAEEAPGDLVTEIRPFFQVVPGSAKRIEFVNVQLYAGPLRDDVDGLAAAAVAPSLAVEQLYPDPRTINRVEVSGEQRAGQIAAVSVEALGADGVTWSVVATGEGQRAAADLEEPLSTEGIRVWIEEHSGGPGGLVWVSEVDAMLVTDVSDQVQALTVQWSRETDPGTATSPVGNYEASTIDLTLENTEGQWLPQRNASIDLGHRIAAAIGIRWSNFLTNPRAEIDTAGWVNVRRVADLDPEIHSTGFAVDALAGATAYGYGPAIEGNYLATRRLSGWVKLDGPPGTTATFRLVSFPSSADPVPGDVVNSHPAVTIYPGEWAYLPSPIPGLVHASGSWFSRVELKVVAGAGGPATLYATRMNVQILENGAIAERETMLPAGVFYSEPYDTDSTSPTVTVTAVDRLSRFKDLDVSEGVRVDETLDQILRELALRYLDYDTDQLAIADSVGDYVMPYAYPSGGLGSYFADLAKAVLATLHVDPLDRLAIAPRSDVNTDPVTEIRSDNSLISYSRPPGYDVTTSIVEVNASPLALSGVVDLWAMPSGGIAIAASETYVLDVNYDSAPAVNAFVSGVVADGAYTISAAAYYADRARITIHNLETRTLVVADLRVRGNPLVAASLTARLEDPASVRRYGPRTMKVDAKLVQTQAQVVTVAEVLLDTFKAVDEFGVRRLPDLTFNALGLLHVTAGDRVTLVDPRTSLGSDYAVLARELSYAGGAVLLNGVRVREASSVRYAIADDSIADDVYVAGY